MSVYVSKIGDIAMDWNVTIYVYGLLWREITMWHKSLKNVNLQICGFVGGANFACA